MVGAEGGHQGREHEQRIEIEDEQSDRRQQAARSVARAAGVTLRIVDCGPALPVTVT